MCGRVFGVLLARGRARGSYTAGRQLFICRLRHALGETDYRGFSREICETADQWVQPLGDGMADRDLQTLIEA